MDKNALLKRSDPPSGWPRLLRVLRSQNETRHKAMPKVWEGYVAGVKILWALRHQTRPRGLKPVWIGQYILDDDGNPQPEPDTVKWGLWFEHSHKSKGKDNRILCKDNIGSVHVSTVFLGLDHNHWNDDGPPILWETMIFGGEHDEYQRRYSSKDAAIIGHNKALEIVKGSQADLLELERMALAGGWEKK